MLFDRSARSGAGETFGGRSRWTDVDGPVHYLDFGGPSRAPVIVAVHGLGGSAVNWSAIAPLLTSHYRLIAPDLAGFGLTRLAGRDATVFGNRALLHRFIESVPAAAKKPVILMGNSMGGMISVLEASSSPETVANTRVPGNLRVAKIRASSSMTATPEPSSSAPGASLVKSSTSVTRESRWPVTT